MQKFPLVPIGQVLVVRIISDDRTAGGLHLPKSDSRQSLEEYVVAEVIGSGTGNYSITGDRLPNEVNEGDTIIFQAGVAMGISQSVRREIIERGVAPEQLQNVCIVMHDNVVAKLLPKQPKEIPSMLVTDGDAIHTGEFENGVPVYRVKTKEVPDPSQN